jgi:hypothetical protein
VYFLKAQAKIDEFAFVLLAGIVFILILAVSYSTLQQGPVTGTLSTSSLQIAQGNSATVTLSLNGTGFNVTLSGTGPIANWINFDENNFDLSNHKDVTVNILVPRNADFGTYTGNILIASGTNIVKVPLSVDVTLVTVSTIPKSIGLGDFTVSYLVGTNTLAEKDDVEVARGYFADYPVSFTGTVPDDKINILTDGFIQIFVETSNSAGNLFVEFNGQRVYANTISTGEIDIPLNASLIHKYNSVVVHADTPGIAFWQNTDYKIKFIKFGIDFSGISSHQKTFSLAAGDLKFFNSGRLSFQVKDYNPNALNPMLIQINGVTFYDDAPTLTSFSKTFGSEIPLFVGDNTISFSVSQEAYYQLATVILTIYHHI